MAKTSLSNAASEVHLATIQSASRTQEEIPAPSKPSAAYPPIEEIRPFAYREPTTSTPDPAPAHPLRRGSDRPRTGISDNGNSKRGN